MATTINQIMIREVHHIDVNTSLNEAKKMLSHKNIQHLPVISDGKLVGIISRTDIMRLSFGDTYENNVDNNEKLIDKTLADVLTVGDAMSSNLITVSPTDSVKKTANYLTHQQFHALPVVEKGELVGIVTTTDIIQHLLNPLKEDKIPKKKEEAKAWGKVEQFCQDTYCSVKLLHIAKYQKIGLRYHKQINKYWRVIDGKAIVFVGDRYTMAKKGDEFKIPAKTKHQLKTEKVASVILEICYGASKQKDLVRIIQDTEQENNILI